MNNVLIQKNEEAIKQNSADFLTLCVYSKDILKLDYLHLLNYKYHLLNKSKFLAGNETKNDLGSKVSLKSSIDKNKFKFMTSLGISLLLIYKFRSILIIPIFFSSYFITKSLISATSEFLHLGSEEEENRKINSLCNCYFCEENKIKKLNLDKYDYYFNVIDYVFEKNPNIKNLEEFQKDLAKIRNIKNKK
jgi:hypothetical protein